MVANKKENNAKAVDAVFLSHFSQGKAWVSNLHTLLRGQSEIHRRDIEALDSKKYFMRDQIERLITLGIVLVHARNSKNQPLVLKSLLYNDQEAGK